MLTLTKSLFKLVWKCANRWWMLYIFSLW